MTGMFNSNFYKFLLSFLVVIAAALFLVLVVGALE
jgi:hypothetical protein